MIRQPKRTLIEGDGANGLWLVGNRLELVVSGEISRTTVDITALYHIFKELFTDKWQEELQTLQATTHPEGPEGKLR